MLKNLLATGLIGSLLAIYGALLDHATLGSTEPAAEPASAQPVAPASAQPVAPADASLAGKPIQVQLADGRLFAAQLDWHTDRHTLWLRWQRGRAYILRAIEWQDIESVQIAGEQLAPDELRGMVQHVRQDMPLPEQIGAAQETVEMHTLWPVDQPGATLADYSTPTGAEQTDPRRVRSLNIEVQAANWDADVETDGLLVCILPRDQAGRIVPVRGTVHVELWARRWGVVKQALPYGRLGHWSKSVAAEDFAGHGASLRLPFQSTHPEFARDLDPRGAVHVRLAVPGQGTFEATDAMVRLRPYSAVRDRLEQDTGRRFFPRELIGAGPR